MINLERLILKDIGETMPYGDSTIDKVRYNNVLELEKWLDLYSD